MLKWFIINGFLTGVPSITPTGLKHSDLITAEHYNSNFKIEFIYLSESERQHNAKHFLYFLQ